jgi:uncharacterized cupredoxin-like copper-binding protein
MTDIDASGVMPTLTSDGVPHVVHDDRIGTMRRWSEARRRRTVAACTLAAVLGACGSQPPAEVTDTLEIVGTDTLAFAPTAYAIAADRIVTVTLTSEAAVEHDLVIEGAASSGVSEPTEGHSHDDEEPTDDLHVAHAEAGGRAGALLLIKEPGTYTVYCSIPGHRAAGMEATLVVVG